MAMTAKNYDKASYRTYCLLGDSETAEGSVWEAAGKFFFTYFKIDLSLGFASHYKLDNLLAIVDINRLGQTRETMLGHDLETYALRFQAFGWHTIKVDGHNVDELLRAYDEARLQREKPTVILAKTFKGRGIQDIEDKDGFHGKAVEKKTAEIIRSKLTSVDPLKDWKIPKPVEDSPNVDLKRGSNKVFLVIKF